MGTSSAWLMQAKTPRSSKFFQHIFGAHVELFREVADGDAFGNGDFARRARRAAQRAQCALARRSPTPGRVRDRVQLAFAFFEALLQRGTRARGGLRS